ncbi:hypothetical protein [Luedemannella flava]
MTLTRRHVLTAAAAGAAATLLPARAATAAHPSATGLLQTTAPSLHPEGIAWDPLRRAYLVSSVRHGTVSVVGLDGCVRTLIADDRMISTLGVHVDARRGRVLVAFADIGVGTRSTPATMYASSGLGIFDLATGRARAVVPLTEIPGGHVANDIAIDPAGNAYVTDTASDGVYRVDPAGRATVLAQDARLANPTAGLNGIVHHPGGFLLAVSHATGELWRIGLGGQVRQVALDRPLVGGDGLVALPDGTLVAVTNGVLTGGDDAVRTLRGGPGWATARTTHRVAPWPDATPSTATWTPHGVQVLAGSLNVLFGQGVTSDEVRIRRY